MSARTLTQEDALSANVVMIGPQKGSQAVHDLLTAYRANRRTGTANTKTRGEVSGNNKKMYRQKGTGNARHNTSKAPIFVGGGVVFGPRPRDYSKKVTKSTRKLALRRVMGDIIAAGKVHTVDAFAVNDGKTKSFIASLGSIAASGKVLIIGKSFDEQTYLAARNVGWAQLVTANDVNIEEMLLANAIIVTTEALETLAARTA